jgi:hypothetical protein
VWLSFPDSFLWFVLLEEQKNRDKAESGEAKELKKKSPDMFIALHLLLSGALSLLLIEIIISDRLTGK